MPADQAAGLRRRSALQPLRRIDCFFDSHTSTVRLAHALHRCGWTSLLVDARGRVLADSPARSLFDWRQQITRGQLHTLPLPFGDGWHAPGVQGDEPALRTLAQGYDCLLLDAGADASEWTPLPGASHAIALEVVASQASMLQGYALLKTLSCHSGQTGIGLFGDAGACLRLQAACGAFLDPLFCRRVYSVAGEGDAFAALAVRMTGEETGLSARYKTGNT
jgi:hypothetical protein